MGLKRLSKKFSNQPEILRNVPSQMQRPRIASASRNFLDLLPVVGDVRRIKVLLVHNKTAEARGACKPNCKKAHMSATHEAVNAST